MHKSEVFLAVGTHALVTGVRETVRTTVRPEAGLPDLTFLHTCGVAAWFLGSGRSHKAFTNIQIVFPTEGKEPSKGTSFCSFC